MEVSAPFIQLRFMSWYLTEGMSRKCFLPLFKMQYMFIGGQAAKLRDNHCNSKFSDYWGSSSEAASQPLKFYVFLLLGVKQQSCETTIVILRFPINIGGQAAKLRDNHCNSTFSYYWGSSSEAARQPL